MKMIYGKLSKYEKSLRVLFLLFLTTAFLFILGGCGETETPNIPTIATNSNTPCPTNISKTKYPSEYSPIFIYVLVEGTQNYKDLIHHSFEIMGDILKAKIEPRDKVIVSFMEYVDVKLARLFNGEVNNVEIPPYTYTPLIIPTFPTVVPLPTTEGTFGQFVQTTAVQVTETAYSSVLTEVANNYNCGQIEEEIQNKKLFEEWGKNKQQATDLFMNDYSKTISEVKLSDLPETTNPIRALSQASELFNLFGSSGVYKKSFLVIFSNLGSVISNSPAVDGVNLKGINVIVMLQNCTFLSDCSTTINRWEAYFKSAGAATVTFVGST